MIKYHFYSSFDRDEINRIVLEHTAPLKLVSLFKMNSFIGEVKKGKITIGRIPDYNKVSNMSFFCGNIIQKKKGVKINGHFGAPIKLAIIPYAIFCIFTLLFGKLFGLFVGVIACFLLHAVQILLLSINTRSRRDIIDFLKNELKAEIQKS